MKGSIHISKVKNNPFFGLIVVLTFLLWVLIVEYALSFIGGDFAAFIWTTFHFIIDPILGLIISLYLVWNIRKQNQISGKVISLLSIVFPLFISYIGFSGNIWFVELLGINFR
jgi:hypothetical protein